MFCIDDKDNHIAARSPGWYRRGDPFVWHHILIPYGTNRSRNETLDGIGKEALDYKADIIMVG